MRALVLLLTLITPDPGFVEMSYKQMQVDSLVCVLETADDSTRISVLLSLAWELRNTEPEKAVLYGTEAISLAERYGDYSNLAKAYSFVGVAYRVMGKYSESVDHYYKGLETAEKHGISEQAGYAYLNLANLYIYQEHHALASDNIRKAKEIAETTANKPMLAYVYLFYGRASRLAGELDSALINYRKSLDIRKDLNQVAEQATCFKYIGDIYFDKGEMKTADENYLSSLERLDREHDKDLYSNILIHQSMIRLREGRVNEAAALADKGLKVACSIGANMAIRDALQVKAEISALKNDFRAAYEYEHKVIHFNDTLFSQQLSEKIFGLEYQMEKQRRENEIDLLNRDNAIKELELRRIRTYTIALVVILGLLAALSVTLAVMFRHRRDKARQLEAQNQEINRQRDSIEHKNVSLQKANASLEESEENLRRMVQTKDKLFSIIAHDLRNPFTALGGLTEVLQHHVNKLEPGEVAEYASLIREASQKLMNLIENLLQWANSQTGRLKLSPREIPLKAMMEEIIRIMHPQSEAKGISLINNVSDTATVYADYDSVATIFRNLVSNGIKYTGRNGSVTITTVQSEGMVTISVSDTGVGMTQETIGKLFRIEESFTTEGTNKEAGTGLGLIICKEFAEKNKGAIEVKSTPGNGSIFIVSLPTKG